MFLSKTFTEVMKLIPIYPRVNGKTLKVHGEKLVTKPAPKIIATLSK